jgi:chitinase
MVSAFGDAGRFQLTTLQKLTADKVISTKTDPVGTAQAIAAWVKKYAVDGVDIDLEGMSLPSSIPPS